MTIAPPAPVRRIRMTTGNDAYVKARAANSSGALSDVVEVRQARRTGPFHADATDRTVTGTTSETALETITVPAGRLGLDGALELDAQLSATGLGGTKTIRLKFGGTTIHTKVLSASYQSTIYVRAVLFNLGSASSQIITGFLLLETDDGSDQIDVIGNGTSINTGSAADLVITGQLADGGDVITLNTSLAQFPGTV